MAKARLFVERGQETRVEGGRVRGEVKTPGVGNNPEPGIQF
jgi:hypothetical protein